MKVQHEIHMQDQKHKNFIIRIEFARRAEATSFQTWIQLYYVGLDIFVQFDFK